jgi:hypothetical protein
MAGAMGTYTYNSDNGNAYRIRMDVTNATAVGAATATGPTNKPGRMKPRYILAKHPTSGRERKIICPDATQPIWMGTSDAITLDDFSVRPSAPVLYTALGRIGERRLG